MSQESILKIVENKPGVYQKDVHKLINLSQGATSDQIQRLVKKGDIIRKIIGVGRGGTYELYPVKCVNCERIAQITKDMKCVGCSHGVS